MTWIIGVTLGIALLGAVLGIINTCHQLSRDRVKLKVIPKIVRIVRSDESSGPHLCIEVINLSTFPVTISSVGFRCKGHEEAVVYPILHDGGRWPRRLEPRQSVTAYFSEDWHELDFRKVRKAYAFTECNVAQHGSVKRLKKQVGELGTQLRSGQ